MNYGPINDQFQQILGRAPSQSEADTFNKFLQAGHLDASEIGKILQSSPEFQKTQLNQNTQAYGQMLGAFDSDILGKAAAAGNSQFANLGRPATSAMGGALAQSAQGLAQQRQSQLAAFYGNGLQQNAGLQVSQGQDALNRGYGLRDEARQRQYAIQDYYTQQNDYNNSLNAANRQRRQAGQAGAVGAIGGGILGAYLGGPTGAMAGAKAGSSLGGLF